MSDHGDDNISRQEGDEGSSDEHFDDYELVAEAGNLDTTWESSEVHPDRHFPRPAYGASGSYPEIPPPRVVLTDGPTMSPKRAKSVQIEPLEQMEHERSQQEPGKQAAAGADPRPPQGQPQPGKQAAAGADPRPPQGQPQPGKQAAAGADPRPPQGQPQPGEQAAASADPRPPQGQPQPGEQAAAGADPRPPQEQPQPDEQAAAVGPSTSQEQPQQERPTLQRRIKKTLQRMRLRSSSPRGESPHKPPRDESPPSSKQ